MNRSEPTTFELPEAIIKACQQNQVNTKEKKKDNNGEGRMPMPFAEKSKRAQQYACRDMQGLAGEF